MTAVSSSGLKPQTTGSKIDVVMNDDQVAQIKRIHSKIINQLSDSRPASVDKSLGLGQDQMRAITRAGSS